MLGYQDAPGKIRRNAPLKRARSAWTKSMGIILLLLLAFVLFNTAVMAGPAPWWEWRNSTTGAIVCAQTAPGPGWVKYSGPYEDLKCTVRAKTK